VLKNNRELYAGTRADRSPRARLVSIGQRGAVEKPAQNSGSSARKKTTRATPSKFRKNGQKLGERGPVVGPRKRVDVAATKSADKRQGVSVEGKKAQNQRYRMGG